MKKLLVFASGDAEHGGSGARKLVENSRKGILNADIVGFVSNHESGGVRKHALDLDIPFYYFRGPYTSENYQGLVAETGADYVSLSGWVIYVRGLSPNIVFNIHPAPMPKFGGKGWYGRSVHERVLKAFRDGAIDHTEVCMHFVTEDKDGDKEKGFDKGPVFFRALVDILIDDTVETLFKRVNMVEHYCQSAITSLVVNGLIKWDGKDERTLVGGGLTWDFRTKHLLLEMA